MEKILKEWYFRQQPGERTCDPLCYQFICVNKLDTKTNEFWCYLVGKKNRCEKYLLVYLDYLYELTFFRGSAIEAREVIFFATIYSESNNSEKENLRISPNDECRLPRFTPHPNKINTKKFTVKSRRNWPFRLTWDFRLEEGKEREVRKNTRETIKIRDYSN